MVILAYMIHDYYAIIFETWSMGEHDYFHLPHMHVLIWTKLQKESVTSEVTVRQNSRGDENYQ